MLIDSHCHVLSKEYENVSKIINETFLTDVKKIIINGYDIESSVEAVKLAKKYDNVYAAIGIGPESVNDFDENDVNVLLDLLSSPKVVAIGEIGLDYHWTKENKEKQIRVFKTMLGIAVLNNLPVIVHSRDSILDAYNILEEYKVSGIMHCFSGSLDMARKFVNLGFLIGVGGVVTFKNSKRIKEVVESIDLSSIALETDSPYLTPEPYRGKENSPKYLPLIAKKISELKRVSYEKVADITSQAVLNKFDL